MSSTYPTPPSATPKEIVCQYAKSASATSENAAGSLAIYATGAPDAPKGGDCDAWSGYGYSWTSSGWDFKAKLTLTYEKPVYVGSVTVAGDYDMCWGGAWLRNSKTGEEKSILSPVNKDCTLNIKLEGDFLADQVILESCGWSWSATDAVEMCGAPAGK
ncbi:MAG: hypothetical protein ABIH63_04265 [archaeon]